MPITANGHGFICDRCNRFWPGVPLNRFGHPLKGPTYCLGGCKIEERNVFEQEITKCPCHDTPVNFRPAHHHAPQHGREGALPQLTKAQQITLSEALSDAAGTYGNEIVAGVATGPRGNILTAGQLATGSFNTTLDQQFGGPGHTSIQIGAGKSRISVSNVFACPCVLKQAGTIHANIALTYIINAHIASMTHQVTIHLVCGCACNRHGAVAICPGGRRVKSGSGDCCA